MDRGETRVAILEAEGDPAPQNGDAENKPTGGNRRRGAKAPPKQEELTGEHVAELYIERRGNRSIVGNIYKGKVDNVLPGLEAAFVDIGLDKNGFLHADDIVMPGVEVARRGRGGKGQRITELLKPGQEIVVQVMKDPLKIEGRPAHRCSSRSRAATSSTCPTARVSASRAGSTTRSATASARQAAKLELGDGGAIIRTAAQRSHARATSSAR